MSNCDSFTYPSKAVILISVSVVPSILMTYTSLPSSLYTNFIVLSPFTTSSVSYSMPSSFTVPFSYLMSIWPISNMLSIPDVTVFNCFSTSSVISLCSYTLFTGSRTVNISSFTIYKKRSSPLVASRYIFSPSWYMSTEISVPLFFMEIPMCIPLSLLYLENNSCVLNVLTDFFPAVLPQAARQNDRNKTITPDKYFFTNFFIKTSLI